MAGVQKVARAAGIMSTEAHSMFAAILQSIVNGERVFVKDFGTFYGKRTPARTITSPQITGGKAEVPERNVIRFRPSPVTRGVLNGDVEAPVKVAPAKKPAAPAKPAKPAAKPVPAKKPAAPAKAEKPVGKPTVKPIKKAPPPPPPVEEEEGDTYVPDDAEDGAQE